MAVKILSRGDYTKKLSFEGMDAYSATARQMIEQTGGSIA